jgi:hypothetical protein
MKTSAPLPAGVTVAEFLAMEDASDEKHILWDGAVVSAFAMGGGTIEHATLSANAIAEIGVALRGQRCRAPCMAARVLFPTGARTWCA